LDIPIIALSQLNRSVESREGKRPQLSDLRESGAIEQDADLVLFIHRPEYYGITEDDSGNSLLGVAEIIIAKHRNGATGDIHLSFKKELAKFSEMENQFNRNFGNANQTFSSKMNEEEELAGAGISKNSNFDKQKSSTSTAPF
jgi:replicative DNA helicase